MPPNGKATAAQKGKVTTKRQAEREPPTNVEESESQSEAAPNVEEQGGASAPIPPPGASGQQVSEAIHLLTQLVAAQAQRQDAGPRDRSASTRARDFMALNPPNSLGQSQMKIRKILSMRC